MTALNGRPPTRVKTEIGREFLNLAIGVACHFPACLQGYWGPDEWYAAVMANPPSLEDLRTEAVAVATAIQKSNLPKNRRERLQFQTRALLWLIRAEIGEQIMFREQVRLLLDVKPESVENSVFEKAQEGLAAILPEGDSIYQRWTDWKATYTTQLINVLPQLHRAFTYLGRFWPEFGAFNLDLSPHTQSIRVQPQNLCLPAQMPVRVDRLFHKAAEWGVLCGVVSAATQRFEDGETENAIWLNYGPHQVLTQGLPLALLTAANPYDQIIPDLLHAMGLPVVTEGELQALHMAEDALDWVNANIALMLHEEGMRPRVLRRYMMTQKLVTPETAETQLEQLVNPIEAAHIFAPLIGGPLIKTWLDKSQTPFAQLLNDPPVPSTMLFEVRFED